MRFTVFFFLAIFSCGELATPNDGFESVIREVNLGEIPEGKKTIALVGATLIDGNGGTPVKDACVVIRNNIIESVGRRGEVNIPSDAEQIDVSGMTLLPGLIDAHYHNEDSEVLATMFLRHGVTAVRDPGEWIESYDALRKSGKSIPRLFLSGPHIDTYPPAYPADSYIVKDAGESALAVDRLANKVPQLLRLTMDCRSI